MILLRIIALCFLAQFGSFLTQGAVVGIPNTVEKALLPVTAANEDVESTTEAPLIIEGVDITKLSDEDLRQFLLVLDEKLFAEIDMWIGLQNYANMQEPHNRQKRWVPIAVRTGVWAFGRARGLLRSLGKSKITRGARGKITKQFNRKGDFKKAVRDFHRLKPTGVKRFKGPKGLVGLQGKIGKNGKFTVKVRSTSSGKRPTIDVYRSNKPDRRVFRKFRYNRHP